MAVWRQNVCSLSFLNGLLTDARQIVGDGRKAGAGGFSRGFVVSVVCFTETSGKFGSILLTFCVTSQLSHPKSSFRVFAAILEIPPLLPVLVDLLHFTSFPLSERLNCLWTASVICL